MRRSSARADQSALPGHPVTLPSGTHPCGALPSELVDAIAAALDCEARQTDVHARAELLARVRTVTEAWLAAALTIEEALEALVASPEIEASVSIPAGPSDGSTAP